MNAEWAGIQVFTDHRFVVRHVYGDKIVVTELSRFEQFIGKHSAARIMDKLYDRISTFWLQSEAPAMLGTINSLGELWMHVGIERYMPYANVTVDREASDWASIIVTIDDVEYFVCTISHQTEGDDDRLHIDFYCEEQ